jgi:uncharacterized protein (DUF169 family)
MFRGEIMSSCDVSEYKDLSLKIKNKLELEKSPVAIKLVLKEEDIPEGISKIEKNVRHCEMVQMAARGSTFYATAKEQSCKGGAGAIGLMESPEKVKSGEMYYSLGRFSSLGSAKRTVDAIPKIDPIMKAIIYAPLETAPFDPDVVVVICNPKQAMQLAQAMVYTLGGRFEADFSGIQSICGDAVAGPYTTKKPNITLGCSGSRKFADIKPDDVIVGMNGENIGCVVNALEAL